jgi:uncharacterized membrane protein YtjA (UPF0391 family)
MARYARIVFVIALALTLTALVAGGPWGPH